MFDPWMKTPAAALYMNTSEAWLEKKRVTGGGPIYTKNGRLVSYRRSNLDNYMVERERRSTSDRGGQEQAAGPDDA